MQNKVDRDAGGQPWVCAVPAELRLDPGWQIRSPGAPHALEGWADRTSVLPGEPVCLHVSSVVGTFTATAYRMGWYGAVGAVASGAGVFASGSNWFTRALPEAGAGGVTAAVVGGELSNLLTAFVAGPAGRAHPSHPNLAALNEYRGDPVAAVQPVPSEAARRAVPDPPASRQD